MQKIKYLKSLALSFWISIALCTSSCAVDTGKIREYFKTPKTGLPNTEKMAGTILSVLTTIGYFLAAIVLLCTAVGFIIGSPQKKAQLKEKLWLILIGVAILAGGMPIFNLIFDLMEETGKNW